MLFRSIGDCYLQLGELGPAADAYRAVTELPLVRRDEYYVLAADAYRAVTELPGTDVTTRSQA